MRSSHALVDDATVRLGSLFTGENGFFSRSVDSPRVDELLADISLESSDRTDDSIVEFTAETPVGTLDPAIQVWQWVDQHAPTLIYHHGSDERPFSPRRFSPDSFRDIITTHADQFQANIIAVRAPFHTGTTRAYIRAMGDLENFVAMLATSVATIETLVSRLHEHYQSPVIVSGVSLGGWVTNLHRTYRGSADAYVPMLAGAALGDMFVESSYRRLLGVAAKDHPETVRRTLNFEDEFLESEPTRLYPLLARHDRYIEYDAQRREYDGDDITVVDRGHVTSLLKPRPLRDHLVAVLDRLRRPPAVDSRGPDDAPVVVFVHGAGLSRKLWLPQLESLADSYRTVAPDLPGHGERADEPFDFEAAVDTVERIVRGSDASCLVLVGQSLGGYVATEVAARNPDTVSGLVLSGSSADYRGVLGLRTAISSALFRLGARSRSITDRFERATANRLRSRPVSEAVAAEIVDAGLSLDAWGQAGRALVGTDFPSRLTEYDGPVLLVNGEDDRINRPAAVQRSTGAETVTPVVIRGAGHTVSLEQPETYADLVREFVTAQCADDANSFT